MNAGHHYTQEHRKSSLKKRDNWEGPCAGCGRHYEQYHALSEGKNKVFRERAIRARK